MGKNDVALGAYFSDPQIFADLFNAWMYGGKQVIDPGSLMTEDSVTVNIAPNCSHASVSKQAGWLISERARLTASLLPNSLPDASFMLKLMVVPLLLALFCYWHLSAIILGKKKAPEIRGR